MKCPKFGERAQISIELIIVFAAVVAAVLLIASRIHTTAEEGMERIDSASEDVMKKIDDISKI